MRWMVDGCGAAPDHLHLQFPARPGRVIVQQLGAEADERCSFVGKRTDTQWIWMAMDTSTRQIMAFHVGDRRRNSAEPLGGNSPAVYREPATSYTDGYEGSTGVMPAARHQAMTKLARKTTHLERFHNT